MHPSTRRFAVVAFALSCSRPATIDRGLAVDAAPSSPIADAAVEAAAATPLREREREREPLSGVPWQVDLFDDASDAGRGSPTPVGCVSVPLGAREPRPMMIALHGGSDRPGWACGAWRGITNAYPFLVCPRGVGASEAGLAWSSPADTKARVARAIAATKRAFPGWVKETSVIILAGFSMGATQAAYLAQSEPEKYRRIALAESAYQPEPVMAFARPWTEGGGERVIFLCTTPGCEGSYRNAARNVAKRNVPARLNIAGTTEHGMWEAVVRSMRRDWPWLIEGTEGWSAYVPPLEETALPGKSETFAPP